MIEECRAAMPFPAVWAALGLPDPKGKVAGLRSGAGRAMVCSPFRADKKPGCSVWMAGDRGWFKDFASGDCFDEVGIIAAARRVSNKEAIVMYHEMARVSMGDGKSDFVKNQRGPSAAELKAKAAAQLEAERAAAVKLARRTGR